MLDTAGFKQLVTQYDIVADVDRALWGLIMVADVLTKGSFPFTSN